MLNDEKMMILMLHGKIIMILMLNDDGNDAKNYIYVWIK